MAWILLKLNYCDFQSDENDCDVPAYNNFPPCKWLPTFRRSADGSYIHPETLVTMYTVRQSYGPQYERTCTTNDINYIEF
jgi:hypothetical protein